ncbi:MAG: hypothetical protein QXK37_01450 [Candidatus Woesearchaeota archaeon]
MLFILAAALYITKYKKDISNSYTEPEKTFFRVYIDACVKRTSVEGAYYLGKQGGFYNTKNNSLETLFFSVPYYYKQGRGDVPTLETIQNQLALYIEDNLKHCIRSTQFETHGYSIEFGEALAEVKIASAVAKIKVDFPVKFIRNDTVINIDDFSYDLPFRIGYIRQKSEEIIEKIEENPNYVDLTFLLNQDLEISVLQYDNCTDIYIILDNLSRVPDLNKPYIFQFAVKFSQCNSTIKEIPRDNDIYWKNSAPVLKEIGYQTAQVGKSFDYAFTAADADNDSLIFFDDSEMFVVEPLTGILNFTPSYANIGLHIINITVVDVKGARDNQMFYLEIR